MTIRASLLVPAIMLFGLSLTACGASMPSALTPPARQGNTLVTIDEKYRVTSTVGPLNCVG